MALKRTLKPSYTDKESRGDRLLREQMKLATIDPHLHPYTRLMHAQEREERYEKRRLENARKSGRGARECARRIGPFISAFM